MKLTQLLQSRQHKLLCILTCFQFCLSLPDLEWKIIYVGSAESEEYDQTLDTVVVGPIIAGRHMFVFEVIVSTIYLYFSKVVSSVVLVTFINNILQGCPTFRL